MATEPSLGTKIKRARERMRWSQEQLAEAVSVSQKTIDNWEHDKRFPKSSIGALEDVLGFSLRDGSAPVSDEMESLRAEAAELRETVLSQAAFIAQLMRAGEQQNKPRKDQEQDDADPEQSRRFRNAV